MTAGSSFLGGLAGGAIGSAVVNLVLDDGQFKSGLASAEATTKGSSSKMGSSLTSFKSVGMAAFAGVAGAALIGAAKAVEAASDQEEALNKAKVVFGAASGEVERFAETSATSLGLSETAALSAAGTFGNFFTAAGLATDQVSDLSKGVVTLASDLASFNNISTDEALEKLRAGLAGEAEPLRTVGVFLSEARVQAEAYESGVAQVGKELTDAQKIQTRYNLILQDTTLAQGDFGRTSDSLANQQRIVAAEVENLAADVGQALIPAVSGLVNVFEQLVPLVSAASTVITPLVGYVDELLIAFLGYKALSFLPELLVNIGGSLQAMGARATGAAVGGAGLSNTLLGLSKSAGAITGALAAFTVAAKGTNVLMDSLSVNAQSLGVEFKHLSGGFLNTLEDVKNSGWSDIGAFFADPFATSGTRAEEMAATGEALLQVGRQAGLTFDQANAILERNSDLLNYNRASQEGFTEAVERTFDQIEAQSKALGEGNITFDAYVSHLMLAGFTSREAFQLASDALDEYGKHVTRAGHITKNFAGMSKDELKDFRESVKEDFAVSGESIFGFKRKFEGSVSSFLRGLDNMRGRAQETLADFREFNRIHIGDSIREFLLQQGPDAIHAFVEANKQGRQRAVEDIGGILEAQKKVGVEIDEGTGKVKNLTGALGRLGAKKANPTITFQYKTEGDPALQQFLELSKAGT